MGKKLLINYICLLYPVFSAVCILCLFFSGVRAETVMSLFLIIGAVAVCVLGLLTARLTEDKIFGLYLIYNVLSGIWCTAFGMPAGVYLGELIVTIPPMMLYFAGRGFEDEQAFRYCRYFILSVLFLGAVAAVLFIFAPQFSMAFLYNMFGERLSSLQVGLGERAEAWIAAVNNMENFWIGDGLGSHGLRAADYQLYIVAHGGLVKLYSEMGLIGTSMIIFVLALIYIKAFRSCAGNNIHPEQPLKKKPAAELIIITIAIVVSIGFNLLDTVLISPVIYFALGRAVRRLNDDRAGEEYVGRFEDEKAPEPEGEGLEGAPAARVYSDDLKGNSDGTADKAVKSRDMLPAGGEA